MLTNFIEELKKSKFYKNIVNQQNIILLYVSGSRLIDVADDKSDYDLVAIVDENIEQESDEYLTYNGKKVHWYYVPLNNFLIAEGKHLIQSYGAVLFRYITEEYVIFVNPKYDSVCKLLIENKDLIAKMGVKKVCKNYEDLISVIAYSQSIDPMYHSKILSHLCVASLVLTGESITPQIRAMLLQLKRIRWQPVSDEAKAWCIERVAILRHSNIN